MPYCAACGAQLGQGTPSCPNCGRPVQVYAPPRRTEGAAIASLILGIAGLVMCPLIPSIIAVILGQQAQVRIRNDPLLDGEALARAGIILGWVGIGFAVLGLVAGLLFLAVPFAFL